MHKIPWAAFLVWQLPVQMVFWRLGDNPTPLLTFWLFVAPCGGFRSQLQKKCFPGWNGLLKNCEILWTKGIKDTGGFPPVNSYQLTPVCLHTSPLILRFSDTHTAAKQCSFAQLRNGITLKPAISHHPMPSCLGLENKCFEAVLFPLLYYMDPLPMINAIFFKWCMCAIAQKNNSSVSFVQLCN